MAERLVGYSQLQARLAALKGPQKMKLMAAVARGELVRATPRKTGLTGSSWQVGAVTDTSATVTGSIVNLWLDEGTGLYGPRHAVITPKAKKAMRWAATASKGFRLSGAPRSVKGNVVGYAFARSIKGMRARPFIKRALGSASGKLGAEVVVKIWDDAA
jgi:hypothetical protein